MLTDRGYVYSGFIDIGRTHVRSQVVVIGRVHAVYAQPNTDEHDNHTPPHLDSLRGRGDWKSGCDIEYIGLEDLAVNRDRDAG